MDRLRLYLPQLEFCCCGCSLRAGSLVIGWAVLISHALIVSLFSNVAVHYASGKAIPPAFDDGNPAMTKLELIGVILTSTACMITAFILIVGIHKSKAKYLVPIIVLLSLTAIIEILVFTLSFIVIVFEAARSLPPSINIGEKLLTLFDGFLNIYFVLVIHSYYNILSQSSSYMRENV